MPVVDGDNPQHAKTTQISDAALKLAQQAVLASDADDGSARWTRAVCNHDVAALNAILELFPGDDERLTLLNTKIRQNRGVFSQWFKFKYSVLSASVDHKDNALAAFNAILAAYPNNDSRYAALLDANTLSCGTLLHYVCQGTHAAFIPAILNACPDHQSSIALLNTVDENGNTALHLCNKTDGLIKLLTAYPDNDARMAALNIKNKQGETVLHANTSKGRNEDWETEKNIQAMLDVYSDDASKLAALNAVDEDGNTALHIAVQSGNVNNITLLLAAYPTDEVRQAALNHKNNKGELPLHCTRFNSFAAAKVILDAYATDENRMAAIAEQDGSGRTTIENAFYRESPDVDYLQYLFSFYPDDDARYAVLHSQDGVGNTSLHRVMASCLEVYWEESSHRAIQLLFAACPKERLVELLNTRNHNGDTAFHEMLGNDSPEFDESLNDIPGVENQLAVLMARNRKGYTLFHRIAYRLDKNAIEKALGLFPDKEQRLAVLTATDKRGNTSLHLAVRATRREPDPFSGRYYYLSCIKMLMNAFPDATSKLAALNAKNNDGKTAMQLIADMPELRGHDKKEIQSFLEATKAACETELHPPRASKARFFKRSTHSKRRHNDVSAAASRL